MSRIKDEKQAISQMIALYCRKKHGIKELCSECLELERYAFTKLDNCRHGENKEFCSKCTTHCYGKKRREQIRCVMRFSGPRMIFHNPILAIKHLTQRLRK